MKKIYLVFIVAISILITLSFGDKVSAATSSDGYVWPIDVNSARSVYTSDFYNGHPAIDIAANAGTPIVAAKGGTVYCASTASTSSSAKCSRCGFTGAGYHVVIKQSDGKYAMYAHMSKVSVTTGTSIATGKKIGEVGNTGISNGAHLHFGIYNPYSNGSINYNSFTEPLKVLTPFCNVYADNITNTSAVLHGQFGAISLPFSSAGIYFGTTTTNMKKIVDNESYGYVYPSNIEGLYFETSTYCGQLQKGVTYYYQIWIINDGKEYKSDIYQFTVGDKSSSAQVTDKATYSVSWTDEINEISQTNAKVGKICHLTGINNLSVTKVGIFLYDNKDNLLDSLTESTVNAGFAGESSVHIWYDIYNELGFSLSGGSTYKYKLMVEINGKTHYSPVYSFTTKGCEHNYVFVEGINATCTESGENKFKCSKCGATDTVTIAPLGHSFDTSYTVDKEATCLEEGSKSLHCKRCFVKKNAAVIPQKGHDWNAGVITTAASCGKEGVRTFCCSSCFEKKTESIPKTNTHIYSNSCDTSCNVCGKIREVTHSYSSVFSSDKNSHWFTCGICGNKKGISAHTPGSPATETTPQKCTDCGFILVAAIGHTHSYKTKWENDINYHWHECSCGGINEQQEHRYDNECDEDCSVCSYKRSVFHSYGEGHITTQPTAENEGTVTYTCTVCGKTKTESIPALENTSQTLKDNTLSDIETTSIKETSNDKNDSEEYKQSLNNDIVFTFIGCIALTAIITSVIFVIVINKKYR